MNGNFSVLYQLILIIIHSIKESWYNFIRRCLFCFSNLSMITDDYRFP